MEKNESYGIILELITEKFKKGLKETSKYVKAFGQGVKESFNEQVNQSFNDFKNIKDKMFGKKVKMPEIEIGYEKQIEYVKAQMQEIEDVLSMPKNGSSVLDSNDILKLEAEYEVLQNKLKSLIDKQEEYNNELEEMGNKGTKSTSLLSSLFDSSIGKIKRFTYYLLGARSAFSMFMKYQSIYYQYNEKMQYQSELSQNAIALSLAPAFEFLGNMIAYASIGFAKFIELLTGINVLSKVSTKGIRDYNKSLKETQSLLSGVDEITNLNMPSGTGLADQYKALDDFQKKVAEVEKFFKENKWIESLANGLKKLWEYIKIGYDYIKKHWDIFKYIFGAVAIGLVWTNPLGKVALITGGIMAVVGWLDKLETSKKKNKTATDKLRESEKKLNDLYDKKKSVEREYIQAVDEEKEARERLATILGNYRIKLTDLIDVNGKTTKSYSDMSDKEKEVYKAYLDLQEATENLSNVSLDYKDVLIDIGTEETKHKGSLMELDKKYDETFINLAKRYRNGEIDAKEFTSSVSTYLAGMSDDYKQRFLFELPDDLKEAYIKLYDEVGIAGDALKDGTMINYKALVNMTKSNFKIIKSTIDDTFKDRIFKISAKYNIDKNSVLSLVNKVKGISSLLGVPDSTLNTLGNKILKNFGYAKGLDYVPYDNYPAMLHKGEAVVPAKYNPTIHSTGNEYTNSLLETLVMKIDDLSRRPNEFIVDGQKFASATYPLYEEQRNRQNYVEGVVVR